MHLVAERLEARAIQQSNCLSFMDLPSENDPLNRVTHRELAECLGVHPSTVSRALKGDSRISETTRDRVLAAAKAAGFRPDPALARLNAYRRAGKRGGTERPVIGFLGQSKVDARIGASFKETAESMGYAATLLSAEWFGNMDRLRRYVYDTGLDGIAIHSNRPCPGIEVFRDLRVVWMGSEAEAGVPSLFFDNAEAVRLAYSRALAQGARRIGAAFYTGPVRERAFAAVGAFLASQVFAGPSIERLPPFCSDGELDLESYRSWLEDWSPDFLIGHNPSFYWKARELGWSIPERMSFVALNTDSSFDGYGFTNRRAGKQMVVLLDLLYRSNARIPVAEAPRIAIVPEFQTGD